VSLGDAYAGRTVRIRFVIGTDASTGNAGWDIDDIAFANIVNRPFAALVPDAAACYTITAQSGTPQWTFVGNAFAAPLEARVRTRAGLPVAGVPVIFTAPGGGASASFGGSSTVFTDSNGIASAPPATANSVAGAYRVIAAAGLQATVFGLVNAVSAPHLDIDGDGRYDALTDGLLLIRYLRGFSGPSLANGAVGIGAKRADPDALQRYIDSIGPLLDVDRNGVLDALTDGILLLRYLLGLRGEQLIAGAIGDGALRTTAPEIEAYLQSLLP
jgi:hypothetical protein